MSNQLATQPARKEIRTLIESDAVQQQLAIALPRYYTPAEFSLIVRTAINKNPKLAECDQGSFLVAMLTAAQMGLLPNGREGHLIPRWNGKTQRNECTFQPDYKGIVGLIRRNQTVADVYAVTVHAKDTFKITQGLHRDIVHEPDYTTERGPLVGVYAVILYKSGLSTWEFLPRTEVEAIRARSDSWKSHEAKGFDTPWITDEGEMFKKTALKRVAKLADISSDTLDRLHSDPDIRLAQANAVEIKPAQIPDLADRSEAKQLPAREEKAQEDEQPEKPAAEAKEPPKAAAQPAQHEAAKPVKKLAKKTEQPPTPKVEEPNKTEILKRLSEGGWTEAQFEAVLSKFEIGDRDEDSLGVVLENWGEVAGELKLL